MTLAQKLHTDALHEAERAKGAFVKSFLFDLELLLRFYDVVRQVPSGFSSKAYWRLSSHFGGMFLQGGPKLPGTVSLKSSEAAALMLVSAYSMLGVPREEYLAVVERLGFYAGQNPAVGTLLEVVTGIVRDMETAVRTLPPKKLEEFPALEYLAGNSA